MPAAFPISVATPVISFIVYRLPDLSPANSVPELEYAIARIFPIGIRSHLLYISQELDQF